MISASTLMMFMLDTQKDSTFAKDLKVISNFIAEFVQDPQRETQEPFFTAYEVR